jgi:hypothetical protein
MEVGYRGMMANGHIMVDTYSYGKSRNILMLCFFTDDSKFYSRGNKM